jgi:hypothetical protein
MLGKTLYKSFHLGNYAGEGDQSLAELALRVGGPRAPWDPLVIRGLLSRGRRAAAAAALRQLLARLTAMVRFYVTSFS